MSRLGNYSYPAPTPDAATALIRYSSMAAAHLRHPSSPLPDPALLLEGLPQGPLTGARIARGEMGEAIIAFTIKERRERFIEPEGFLLLRVLNLGGCGIHIDTSERGSEGYHYIEIGSEAGLTFNRILTDSQLGEIASFLGDHHDLTAPNLSIGRGSMKAYRGRAEALAEAFDRFRHNAPGWGLERLVSRRDYHSLIRNAFGLYDLKAAGRFLRPIPEPKKSQE